MTTRVALNVLHLVPRETGGGELYARRLIPALLDARPELELTVLASHEAVASLAAEPWAPRVRIEHVHVSARSRPRRVLAEQLLLPLAVRRARPQLLHNLFTTAPVFPGVPQVTTILDVIYKRFPETHAGVLARGLELLVPLAARRSRRVITLSEAARDDIVRFLRVDRERVDVTHLGPGSPEGVPPRPEDDVRRELRLGDERVALTVSAKRPHKNLARLLEALALIPAERRPLLVVPGYETSFEAELRDQARRLGVLERVRFTGWVDDATLLSLYDLATLFVFPSLAEGFGLPVLEAMLRGTPVACSATTSLPELTGEDAALLFDPERSEEIAAAMDKLLTEPELRERLIAAGRRRASSLTWDVTAKATLAAYDRALERQHQNP
jgi:glycosyltransferase involved in cell wall biosynthesis